MSNIAIIVPTLNRIEFILRLISFYQSSDANISLYIGDSTPNSNLNLIKKATKINVNFQVHYFHFPKLNDGETIYQLSLLVKEEFLAFTGDDDFLNPEALIECSNFLKNNSNFNMAHGRAYQFKTEKNDMLGKVAYFFPYWKFKEILDSTAYSRILSLSKDYYVPEFSLSRSNEFREAKKPSTIISDRILREFISSYSLICNGRSKFINCFYMLRQTHKEKGESDISYTYKNSDQWKKNSDWNKSIIYIKNYFVSKLIDLDSISEADARNKVDVVFKDMINRDWYKEEPNLIFYKKIYNYIYNTLSYFKKILKSKIINNEVSFEVIDHKDFKDIKNIMQFLESYHKPDVL